MCVCVCVGGWIVSVGVGLCVVWRDCGRVGIVCVGVGGLGVGVVCMCGWIVPVRVGVVCVCGWVGGLCL